MSNIQVQLRRGTTAQHGSFTGAQGELTVDTDKNALVLHDGATQGGIQIARESVVNVLDYGADNTGATDARGAIQNAITQAQSSGGIVYIPEGVYLINSVSSPDTKGNGLLLPYTTANDPDNRVIIKGAGRGTILKAGSNDMYVIRLSDSFCKIQDLTIDGNNKTSVVGIGLVPEDRTQTLTLVNQNYNIITGLYIKSCEFGSIYSTGPDASGDSGCWYNVFENSIINFCTTGILLDASTNASGSNSGVNRNKFLNLRFGQSMNTGVQIDDGDTNTFTNCDFEGINTGTSPNATPTAIKIAQTGSSSTADCNHNTFISCKLEANTRDIDNDNSLSEFYGTVVAGSKLNFTANPLIMLGGNDASQAPQLLPGYIYQANSQIPGSPNNKSYFPNGLATDDARISTYHHFRSVAVGTIAGSGTANATIVPAQNNKRYAVEVFVVGDDTGSSSTFQARGFVIANWVSTVGQRIGIGDTVFKHSLGVSDYRAYSGISLSVSWSSNNAVLTITNNGASNLTNVNVLVRHLWS